MKSTRLYLVLLLLGSCRVGTVKDRIPFQNPVFEPILADPTVVRAEDGWFYAYGTQDDWGDGQGSRLIPIVKSADLVHWKYVGNAFETKPAWKEKGGIWAPDIVKVNNRYHLYYAFSVWGDANPGIGVATADRPEGPFTDYGKVFLSDEVDVPNSIDPFYWEENGKKYLFWGSYDNTDKQGTYGVELSDDGKSVPDLTRKIKIAAGDFEAVVIHKKGNYYYFIGSKENCCEGENSKYHLRMGRAESLLGPYRDKEGNDLTNRNTGTVMLEPDSLFAGPGHNSRIITDDNQTDWVLYHAILRHNPRVKSGANRRVLMLGKVNWENGWPVVDKGKPAAYSTESPVWKVTP